MPFDADTSSTEQREYLISYSNRKKVLWILLFILFDLLVLTLYSAYPIPISQQIPVYYQIPWQYWLILTLFMVIWWLVFSKEKNISFQLIGIVLFYFVIFSPNLFFVSPYQQTDASVSRFISIIANANHIGAVENTYTNYFEWPMFFLLMKVLIAVPNLSTDQLLHVGIFSFNMMMPIFLLFIYKSRSDGERSEYPIIMPIIYILLGYMFIVNQFAPQTMALLVLFLTFGMYERINDGSKREKTREIFIFILIYFVLVFTHPFFFIFALVPIIMDYLYKLVKTRMEGPVPKENENRLIPNIIVLLLIIYFTGFIYRFISIEGAIEELIEMIGTTGGEAWNSIFSAVGVSRSSYESPFFQQLEFQYMLLSYGFKALLGLFGVIFLYSLIHYRAVIRSIKSMDVWMVSWSSLLYLFGLFSVFLGQRSVQVILLPVSRLFSTIHKQSKVINALLAILVVSTPIVLLADNFVNLSIMGESFLEDQKNNQIGSFADSKIPSDKSVMLAESIYPVSQAPYGFYRYNDVTEINDSSMYGDIDAIIYTPKLNMLIGGFGYDYMEESNNFELNRIYSSKDSAILIRR